MAYHISCKTFEQLSLIELYEILKIRQEVFIVEQDCPYLDADDLDKKAHHMMLWDEQTGRLAAYTRLLEKGLSYPNYCSIGRVLSHGDFRQKGYGRLVMQQSIYQMKVFYPTIDIKISAQTYLLKFYNSLGFKEVGEGYLEDGIPHIGMIREQNA